ncbi:protein shisa-like-1 [Lampetra fluviatilis]
MTRGLASAVTVATALLCALIVGGLGAYHRVCEPYTDHVDKYHPGFHCPRLSDDKARLYCCRRSNATLKYCCNESEFQHVMAINLTADAVAYGHNNYGGLIGVWIYGLLMITLVAVDLLFYCTTNYELCRVYLARCGLQCLWGPGCPGSAQANAAAAGSPALGPAGPGKGGATPSGAPSVSASVSASYSAVPVAAPPMPAPSVVPLPVPTTATALLLTQPRSAVTTAPGCSAQDAAASQA